MTKYLTRQEMFTKAWNGLAGQGWAKSVNDKGLCMYRGDNGCKCAIGHLISDNNYSPSLEDHNMYAVKVRDAADIDPANMDFSLHMQQCHDMADSKVNIKFRFRELALTYGLEAPQ